MCSSFLNYLKIKLYLCSPNIWGGGGGGSGGGVDGDFINKIKYIFVDSNFDLFLFINSNINNFLFIFL